MKTDIERAIMAAQRGRLPEISAVMWKAWSAGGLTDAEAEFLSVLIETRKAAPMPQRESAVALQRRRAGPLSQSSASMQRRRAWTSGGWLPPRLAAQFTMGEAAAVAAIVAEIAVRGVCELVVGAIAARAGVSESTVRNGRRQAVRLGLLSMVEDRRGYDRSGPNQITILSRELALWVRTRARVEARQGWVQDRAADHQPSSTPSSSGTASAVRRRDFREERDTGSALPGCNPTSINGKSIVGHLAASWRGFRRHR